VSHMYTSINNYTVVMRDEKNYDENVSTNWFYGDKFVKYFEYKNN